MPLSYSTLNQPPIDDLNPEYEDDPATDRQLSYLRALCARAGRKLPADITKRQAHELIGELQGGTWLTAMEVRNATACPQCEALIRTFCRRADGAVRKANHKRRVTLAVEARNAGSD